MTKKELRKKYLQQRQSLTENEYLSLNRQLCEQFFANIDLSFVKVVHTFIPVIEKREVDTWLIIDRIRREFPHIRLSIPKVNPQTNQLDNYFFEGLHQLKKNNWGILEPQQGTPTPPEKIDLVLVPLLAFDKQGNRVGYGKGYYDKFLSACRPGCKKTGLSLFEAVNKIDDVHEWDVPLDHCVSPSGIQMF
ncbi:MAG: 5-formyltetrahydrofolate cyclo-ligase [Cyclobacteriaceae bacterium]|nr:5-formyltetrahydrofolate cyclo-ligase [Cyclobacteriaceae bacterium]